jgi:Fic family protein
MIYKTPSIDAKELKVISQTNEIRQRLQYSLLNPTKWTGLLRRNQFARAIQGSNAIEGFQVTFEEAVEVFEGEKVDTAAETRRALIGYQRALTYVLRLSDDPNLIFDESLIRSLHYMMLDYDPEKRPGQWRTGPIYVRREPSGERVYEGPDASLVPLLMREFVQDIQHFDKKVPVLVKAAMAHLNLVMIHPFSDGNGRMGRAIQTLVLTRDGILSPLFSSIEEYLGSRGNTEAYYSILADVGQAQWRPENDARPWVRFCLRAHLQQATTLDRRVKEISRLFDDLEIELRRRNLNQRMIYALYDAAIGFRVKSERYRIAADVSPQVAAKDLSVLVHEGLLIPKGEKRGRIYIASKSLFEIREKAREQRKSIPQDIFGEQLDLLS